MIYIYICIYIYIHIYTYIITVYREREREGERERESKKKRDAYSESHNTRWGVASPLGVLSACLCRLSGGAHSLFVPMPGCLGVPAICLCANRPDPPSQ